MAKTAFSDGNPLLGILGTIVNAIFLNKIFTHRHDGIDQDGSAPLDYAADTGAANAYAIALTPALTANIEGFEIHFKATNANTAASNLQVNGMAAKALVQLDGSPLVAGCIKAGQIVSVIYNGVSYMVLNPAVIPDYIGPNLLINSNFSINQRGYVSGAAVGAGLYGHDRWKMGANADTYTFATVANVTTVTIPAGKVLQQVVEGINLQSGTYILSWTGTAQAKIGAGAYGASGVTGAVVGGTNTTIEWGPGTVSKVKFEPGTLATTWRPVPYTDELIACMRYFEISYTSVQGAQTGSGPPAADCAGVWFFKVTKRAVPAFTAGAGSIYTTSTPAVDGVLCYVNTIIGQKVTIAVGSTASCEL